MPSASDCEGATDQLAPDAVVVSVCAGDPEVDEPWNTLTVIVDESPCAVPAAPENGGLLLLVVLLFAGLVSVTAGAFALTANVTVPLRPLFPASSDCCAWAV